MGRERSRVTKSALGGTKAARFTLLLPRLEKLKPRQGRRQGMADGDLDECVIMPDLIHGILIINGRLGERADARTAPTLSDIVCSFKSRSAVESLKYIKRNHRNMCAKIWQGSLYKHVINSERALKAIRAYMAGHPVSG